MHPVRVFRWAGAADYDLLADIMFDAVRNGESRYTEQQRAAWVPTRRMGPEWTTRLERQEIVLVEQEGRAVGFASLAAGGYVDFAYIRPEAQQKGLFRQLLSRIIDRAVATREPLLWTHASLMAEPAFKRLGFTVRKREQVKIGDESLERCEMEIRLLSSGDPLPHRLETIRLVLRRPTLDDASAMFEGYSSDPQVTRYLGWLPHRSRADAERYLSERIAEWDDGVRWTYALTLKPSPSAVGHVRLTPSDEGIGFGYALAAHLAGQGLATEALSALIPLAERLSQRLWAYCDAENQGSIRVLEKCGFSLVERRRRCCVFPNISPDARDCLLFERCSTGSCDPRP